MKNNPEMIYYEAHKLVSKKYPWKGGDQKLDKGTITVNKSDGIYVLSKGKVIDNKFTAATYRVIKECLKDGFYPEKYANGWG